MGGGIKEDINEIVLFLNGFNKFDLLKIIFIKIFFHHKITKETEPPETYYQQYDYYYKLEDFINEYPINISSISSLKKDIYIDILLCLEDSLNNNDKRIEYNRFSEDEIKSLIQEKLNTSGGSFRRQRTIKVIRKY